MTGAYDEFVPFITILIWNAVTSFNPVTEYLYSLNVSLSSEGVTVVSEVPVVLNGIQLKSFIFLASSEDVVLKYTSTFEVYLILEVNLTSIAVDKFSNITGLVKYEAADDVPTLVVSET